jgi:hypothetical protein
MNRSPKSTLFFSNQLRKTQPLSLKEVLQLRDGLEIKRNENFKVFQIALPAILKNFNYPTSLN